MTHDPKEIDPLMDKNDNDDICNIIREELARLRTELDALKRDVDNLKNQVNICPMKFRDLVLNMSGLAELLIIAIISIIVGVGYQYLKK